jgi:predicted RNA methylase
VDDNGFLPEGWSYDTPTAAPEAPAPAAPAPQQVAMNAPAPKPAAQAPVSPAPQGQKVSAKKQSAENGFLPEGWSWIEPEQTPWQRLGSIAKDAAVKGLRDAVTSTVGGVKAAVGGMGTLQNQPPEPQDNSEAARLLQTPLAKGWSDPGWLIANMVHAVTSSSPTLALGIGGAAGGGALAGPPGALAGSMGGMAVGSAIQEVPAAYQRARQDHLSHEQAVDRAMKETGIAAAFGAAMGAAPELKVFKNALGEALAEMFVKQPALMAGQTATTNAIEGKPLGQGVAESAVMGAAMGVPLGVGAAFRHGGEAPGAGPNMNAPHIDEFLREAQTAQEQASGRRMRDEIDEFIRRKDAAQQNQNTPRIGGNAVEQPQAGGENPPSAAPGVAPVEPQPPQPKPSGPASPAQPGNAPGETPPPPAGRAAEDDALRAAGFDDEDIALLGQKERAAELKKIDYTPPHTAVPEDQASVLTTAGLSPDTIKAMSPSERGKVANGVIQLGVSPRPLSEDEKQSLSPVLSHPEHDGRTADGRFAAKPLDNALPSGDMSDSGNQSAGGENAARNEQFPRIQNLEGGKKPLLQQQNAIVQGLWGQGNRHVPGVGAGLPTLPSGRGAAANEGAQPGTFGQQQGLPAGQRGLGASEPTGIEHAEKQTVGAPGGNVATIGGGQTGRNASSETERQDQQAGNAAAGSDQSGALQQANGASNNGARRNEASPGMGSNNGTSSEINPKQNGAGRQPGASASPQREGGREQAKTTEGEHAPGGAAGVGAVEEKPRGPTREHFLEVYERKVKEKYDWATKDPDKLAKFMDSVRGTITTQKKTWNHDSPTARAAWKEIGLSEKMTLAGLRKLQSEKSAAEQQGEKIDAKLRAQAEEATPEPKPAEAAAEKPEPTASAKAPHEAIADHLIDKGKLSRLEASKIVGLDPRKPEQKKAFDEAVELGVVAAARRIAQEIHPDDESAAFKRLLRLYDDQPALNSRTSTSIQNQDYSTPAPLAYVAARLADIGPSNDVLEPTAGNGMLLMTAEPKHVVANEIEKTRFGGLKTLGFEPMDVNAADERFAKVAKIQNGGFAFNRVIANPPFGLIKEGGKSKVFDLSRFQEGYQTHEIDHAIALNALEAMDKDGKAALILGGLNKLTKNREDGYHKSKPKREFFLHLYDKFNVVDHFTVSGDLYAKQGAEWPVDVVIIHGRGKSALPLPAVKAPPIFSSWDEIGAHLKDHDYAGVPGTSGEEGHEPVEGAPGERPGSGGEPDQGSEPVAQGGGLVAGGHPEGEPGGVGQAGDRGQPSDRQPAGEPGGGTGLATSGKSGGSGGKANAKPRSAPVEPPKEPEPENPNEPSFLKAFSPGQRAKWDALPDAPGSDRHHATMLGMRLDAMRAQENPNAARIQHLENMLNPMLERLVGKPGEAEAPGARGGAAGGQRRTWTQYSEEKRQARKQARREWEQWREKQKAAEPEPEEAPEKAAEPKEREQETEGQSSYETGSTRAEPMGTLVPSNMKDATAHALGRLKEKHGSLDDYVAKKIGMAPGDIGKHFGGEQVDAVALAIDNMEQNGGFIIGDQCVAGDTLIYDPIAGIHKDIRTLSGEGRPIMVLAMTKDGLCSCRASRPFLKGFDRLYTFTLDDGRRIKVTKGHRFLTPSGWMPAGDLSVGNSLVCVEGPSLKNLASFRSIRLEDAPRSTKIAQGSLDHCLPDSRLCDGRPHAWQAAARAYATSPDDARAHSHSGSPSDALEASRGHSLQDRENDLRSRNNSPPFSARDPSPIEGQGRASSVSESKPTRQNVRLSHGEASSHHQEDGEALAPGYAGGEAHSSQPASALSGPQTERISSLDNSSAQALSRDEEYFLQPQNEIQALEPLPQTGVQYDFPLEEHTAARRIVSIEFFARADFYDMVVEGAHNYVAEGIVSHNTGIGKGRVAAAIIRYAIENDRVPIFFTEKPNLYKDIYRDMLNIGMKEYLGREPKILMTNNNETIPLDDEGRVVLRSGKGHDSTLQEAISAGLLPDHDVLVTTYNQMDPVKGAETLRRQLVQSLARRAVFVFDEAHNVGIAKDRIGKKNVDKSPLRGVFMRSVVDQAQSAFYSSATYAKFPATMDFYRKTNMRLAVPNPADLADAIGRGGVPLQEVVAAMLARDGQYIRRESSFAGIKYGTEVAQADPEMLTDFASGMRAVYEFSDWVQAEIIKKMNAVVRAEGQQATAGAGSAGAGVQSTAFSALMHNLIGQMLLGTKADHIVDRTVRAIQEGQRPVIALTNTMESFLEEYMDATGAKVGDPATLSFNDLMLRYLDKMRRYNLRRPFSSESVKGYLSDEELGPVGLAMFNAAKKQLQEINLGGLPISPIDYIKAGVEKAGYKLTEITGRESRIDYSGPVPVIAKRPAADKKPAGRNAAIKGFISGDQHAILLNASGSTGLSLHDDAPFRKKWPKGAGQRLMILAQPNPDINVHMQTLGRVNRTGQVTRPEYAQIASSSPAEVRIASVLQSKMRSLSANTTASSKSHFENEETPDFLNDYGDMVADMTMAEDPETHQAMGSPLHRKDFSQDGGQMAAVTGHIALLDHADQVDLMNRLVHSYNEMMKSLDAAGMNMLAAKALNLDAKYEHGFDVKPKTGRSVFQDGVHLGQYDVKSDREPIRYAQVQDAIFKALGLEDKAEAYREMRPHDLGTALFRKGAEANARLIQIARPEFDEYRRRIMGKGDTETMQAAGEALDSSRARVEQLADVMPIGGRVRLTLPDESLVSGYVTDFARAGKSKNPFAPSDWSATVAIPGQGKLMFPLSQLGAVTDADAKVKVTGIPSWERHEDWQKLYDSFPANLREKRVIVTGNLLAGYDYTGNKGQIAHFTTSDGKTMQGIVLPRQTASARDFAEEQGREASTPQEVMRRVSAGDTMASTDGTIEIFIHRGDYRVSIGGGRGDGGRYYLDPGVLEAARRDFVKVGGRMVWESPLASRVELVIEKLMSLGARFKVPVDPEMFTQEAPRGWGEVEPENPRRTEAQDEAIRREIERIRDDVLPPGNLVTVATPETIKASAKATLRSGGDVRSPNTAGVMRPTAHDAKVLVAMAGHNPTAAAWHEFWHVAQHLGLATEKEIAVLRSRAEQERLRRFAEETHGRAGRGMPQVELEANFFGAYADAIDKGEAPPRLHATSMKLFERLYAFLRRVRNFIQGRGFQTTEDIAQRFQSGGFKWRTPDISKSRLRHGSPDAESPEFASVQGSPGRRYFGDEGRSILDRIPRPDLSRLEENFLDLSAPVRDMARDMRAGLPVPPTLDPYKAKRLLPGKTAAAEQDFHRFLVEPMVKAAKAANLTRQDIAEWLYAKHAPERNEAIDKINQAAQGMGSGIGDDAAQRVIDRLTAEGKAGALKVVAAHVAKIREFILRTWEESGLVSEEQAQRWREQYQNYVPLQGFEDPSMHADERRQTFPGGGMSVRGPEVREAFGRMSIPDDPLSTMVNMAYRAIDRAEKNDALKVAYRFFKSLPTQAREGVVNLDRGKQTRGIDPKTGMVRFEPEPMWHMRDDAVPLKIGGVPHYMVFNDPHLAQAMKRIRADQLPPVLHQLGQMVNVAKSLWTHYNPEFVVRHFFMRYPVEAFANSGEDGVGAMFRMLKKGYPFGEATRAIMAHGALDEAGRSALAAKVASGRATPKEKLIHYYQEMRDAGGLMNFADFGGVEDVKKKLDTALATLTKNPGRATWAQVKVFHEAVNHFTSMLDNAQRLAAYIEQREKGVGKVDAAMSAREATIDFSLRGRFSNWLTLMWPFANTGAQTASRMTRAVRRSSNMRKVVAGAMALGAAVALYDYLMGGKGDDGTPNVEKIPDYLRRLNAAVATPIKDEKGRPYFATWALPYNYAFPFTLGASMVEASMRGLGVGKEKYGDILTNLMHSGLEAFLPVSQENTFIGKMTPEPMRPFLHVGMNQTWTGAPLHADKEPWNEGVSPHLQGKRTTPELWKGAAAAGAAVGFEAYPEDYREVLGYFTSAAERLATHVAATGAAVGAGQKPDVSDVPFLRAMAWGGEKSYGQADAKRFYDERREAYGVRNQLKELQRRAKTTGNPEDAAAVADFAKANAAQIGASEAFKTATGRLGQLHKQMEHVEAQKGMPEAERQRQLDTLRVQEAKIRDMTRMRVERASQ